MSPQLGSASPSLHGMAKASVASSSPPAPPCGATAAGPSCRSAGCWCAIRSAGSRRRRCCAPRLTIPRAGTALVRAALAPGSHLRGDPSPSGCRDPAALVRPRHRAHTPCLLGLFSLITLLAARLGAAERRSTAGRAWYRKRQPTFSDILAIVRRHSWHEPGFPPSRRSHNVGKPKPALQKAIVYALCNAA